MWLPQHYRLDAIDIQEQETAPGGGHAIWEDNFIRKYIKTHARILKDLSEGMQL